MLALGLSAVTAFVQRQEANLNRSGAMELVVEADDPPADAAAGRDLNILLLGSDSRDGENEQIGGADSGQRADTTIVMHVSADRDRVEMVSIPRDSLVDIPACRMADGSTTSPQPGEMINKAFQIGWKHGGTTDTERQDSAIACAVSTVQENTGLRIDHFVVVDFVGFQDMVTALGGVDICIEQDLKDPKYTGLDLRAGMHHLNGVEALQLARARHVLGSDGMDPSRI
ncbi:MAG: LCP family protein, partial [Cellulomonas sp.]|nr:LCP family protein [Cellulomonas sp.]